MGFLCDLYVGSGRRGQKLILKGFNLCSFVAKTR